MTEHEFKKASCSCLLPLKRYIFRPQKRLYPSVRTFRVQQKISGPSLHSASEQKRSVISGMPGYSHACPSQGNVRGSADASRGFCTISAETAALIFEARNDSNRHKQDKLAKRLGETFGNWVGRVR